MKIGILTFHYAYNYGAMLQAYALQTYLIALGYEVEIIDYRIKRVEELYYVLWKPYTYIDGFNKSPLHPFFRIVNSLKNFKYSIQRKQGFKSFPKQLRISLPDYKLNDYDIIICGSDQIWDPMHTYGFDKKYWGEFENFNGTIVSYAPSMGKYKLASNDDKIIKDFLINFDYLSVRDKRTKNICESCSNVCIDEVVDPTLLLSVDDWNTVCCDKIIDYPYILLYDLNNDDELISLKIKKLQKKYNYKVVEIKVSDFGNKHSWKEIYNAGPEQFLSLIKYAKIIVTTSFHATVFSLIFHKEVYASGTTRICDLMEGVGLEERIITESNIDFYGRKINYDIVDKNLKDKIEKSKLFLHNALGDNYGFIR